MLLKFTDLNSPPAVAVSCHYQKIEKLTMWDLEKQKVLKQKISGRLIIEIADKVRIIRKVISIIEIDKYYTSKGNISSSHISENDVSTCKKDIIDILRISSYSVRMQ